MRKSKIYKQYDIHGKMSHYCPSCDKVIKNKTSCCSEDCVEEFKTLKKIKI